MRIARKVTALLTAGLLVGVAAVPTLASWTASENAANTFTSAGFDIELSTRDAGGPYSQSFENPETLEFQPSSNGLQPKDSVYASAWVRLSAESTLDGSIFASMHERESTSTLKNASWAIYSIDPAATCDAGSTTGTPISSGNSFIHLAPEQHQVPLSAGASGQPGSPIQLCFAVTAHDDLEPNAQVQVDTLIEAETADQSFKDGAALESALSSGAPVALEGSTQDGRGPYGPHPQDQPGELLFTPSPLTPGATTTEAPIWLRPTAESTRELNLIDVQPTVQDGTLQGSWQLNTVAADGTCSGTPIAHGDTLHETTAVQPAALRTDGPTHLCLKMDFPNAQPGDAAHVLWEFRAAAQGHPGATANIYFNGSTSVPANVTLEGSTQAAGGPFAPHDTPANPAALSFSPDQITAGGTTTAPLWLRTDARSPASILTKATPIVGERPGFDASWQLIDTGDQSNACSPSAGTVLAQGDSLQDSDTVNGLEFVPGTAKALCVRVTAHADAPAGATVDVTWGLEASGTAGNQPPRGSFYAAGRLSTPASHPTIQVSPTGANGSFTDAYDHALTAQPAATAQSLRPGDTVYVSAWVRIPDPPRSEIWVTPTTPQSVGSKPRLSAPWKTWLIGANDTCDGSVASSHSTMSDGPDLNKHDSWGRQEVTRDAAVQLCTEIKATEATQPGSAIEAAFYLESESGSQRDSTHLKFTLQAAAAFALEASTQGASGPYSQHGAASSPAAMTFAPDVIASGATAAAPLWIRLTGGGTSSAIVVDLPAPTLTPGGDRLRNASWEVLAMGANEVCSPTAQGSVLGSGATLADHTTGNGVLMLDAPGGSNAISQLCFRITAHDGNPAGAVSHITWDVPARPPDHPQEATHLYASGTVSAPSATSGNADATDVPAAVSETPPATSHTDAAAESASADSDAAERAAGPAATARPTNTARAVPRSRRSTGRPLPHGRKRAQW